MTNGCKELKGSSESYHYVSSWEKAALNSELLSSNLLWMFLPFLMNELTNSLPVNAWNPINDWMIFSSSISVNLYCFLLLLPWKTSKITRSPYWCRRPINNIAISVSPEGKRILTITSGSSSRVLLACKTTLVSPSSWLRRSSGDMDQ